MTGLGCCPQASVVTQKAAPTVAPGSAGDLGPRAPFQDPRAPWLRGCEGWAPAAVEEGAVHPQTREPFLPKAILLPPQARQGLVGGCGRPSAWTRSSLFVSPPTSSQNVTRLCLINACVCSGACNQAPHPGRPEQQNRVICRFWRLGGRDQGAGGLGSLCGGGAGLLRASPCVRPTAGSPDDP